MEGGSKRSVGREVKAAVWVARHPGSLLVPGVPAAGWWGLGSETALTAGGWSAASAAVVCAAWYRGHPDSFDYYAAPVARAWRRRWFAYMGRRWRDAMDDCGLVTANRRTGEDRYPRILRVRSWSSTVDVLRVRMAPGQSVAHWQNVLPELAETLRAERVGVEKVKPRVLSLVIQRAEPFTEVIPAPEMPATPEAVDLESVYIGDTELGEDVRISVSGDHVFIAGASGSGKNSLPLAVLRALAPLIREGSVRLWLADPKQSEFAALEPIAYRYSNLVQSEDEDDYTIDKLIQDFRADMEATQRRLRETNRRKVGVRKRRRIGFSPAEPLNLLILDEIGAITAYSDLARICRRDLAVIATQGRATGHRLWGLVQEPTKDTVPIRDLFTLRIVLRVTSAGHVDMVLGEDARARGALADEIPNVPETAGIGYLIKPRTRAPQRIRIAYTDDTQMNELVQFVLSTRPLRAVA